MTHDGRDLPSRAPDRRHLSGPFDIIGDVHGCAGELTVLLEALGYRIEIGGAGVERRVQVAAPAGRTAIFVGDLMDRGPASPDVLRIAMAMVAGGQALAVAGNHDVKFLRWLSGRQPKLTHGLDRTVSQFQAESAAFHGAVRDFIEGLPAHLWLDGGRLAVAHAGIKESMLGSLSGETRQFCLYGDTSGKPGKDGLPERFHWAAAYGGATSIVYGHTPVASAAWVNNTLCIDTGCCFGGDLTALRWPERDIVQVKAADVYTPSLRPFGHPPERPRTLA